MLLAIADTRGRGRDRSPGRIACRPSASTTARRRSTMTRHLASLGHRRSDSSSATATRPLPPPAPRLSRRARRRRPGISRRIGRRRPFHLSLGARRGGAVRARASRPRQYSRRTTTWPPRPSRSRIDAGSTYLRTSRCAASTDTALATTISPELTTIRQPVTEMSREAVKMLIDEIRRRRANAPAEHPAHAAGLRADTSPVGCAPRRRPRPLHGEAGRTRRGATVPMR